MAIFQILLHHIIFGLVLKKKTYEWWKSWTTDSQCQKRFWWFGRKYPEYLKVYSADLPNWPKILGYWWKRLHRAFIVSGLYHQENASTLWAFNVNEKMQILPLHIKSIVNLNFTRAHESTSPNACTRRCGAAVPPPPRSPAAGFINIFFVAFKWFKMMHMQYYIHVQSECINVEFLQRLRRRAVAQWVINNS